MRKLSRKFALGLALATAVTSAAPGYSAMAANELRIAAQDSNHRADSMDALYLPIGGKQDLKFLDAPASWDKANPMWKSSDNKVATVDKNGVVTGVAEGKVTITFELDKDAYFLATGKKWTENWTATVEVVVGKSVYLSNIAKATVPVETLKLEVGEYAKADTKAKDVDFFGVKLWDKNPNAFSVTWNVTDADTDASNNAVVVSENGLITAVKEGTAWVSATVKDFARRVLYHTTPVTVVVETAKPDKKAQADYFTYDYIDGVYTVTGFDEAKYLKDLAKGEAAEVPAMSDKAVRIAPYAFDVEDGEFANTGVTKIEIGKNIQEIGAYAFFGCSNLVEIEIPKNVNKIGAGAFYGCAGLTEVEIQSENITEIEPFAFDGCTSLVKINIPDRVTKIGKGAFDGCTALGRIDLPRAVTEIGEYAFRGCTNLSIIDIPVSVVEIGAYAFYGCNNIKEIAIPETMTEIGAYAFYGCTGLEEVTIPATVTKIGVRAFYDCVNLLEIVVPESVTEIEREAFDARINLIIKTTGDKNYVEQYAKDNNHNYELMN